MSQRIEQIRPALERIHRQILSSQKAAFFCGAAAIMMGGGIVVDLINLWSEEMKPFNYFALVAHSGLLVINLVLRLRMLRTVRHLTNLRRHMIGMAKSMNAIAMSHHMEQAEAAIEAI